MSHARQDPLKFLRIRTAKHELIITPGSSAAVAASEASRGPARKVINV